MQIKSTISAVLFMATTVVLAQNAPPAPAPAPAPAPPAQSGQAPQATPTLLPPGAPVPVPSNQDIVPLKSATAHLNNTNIVMTVQIALANAQDSPNTEYKTIFVTSDRGLTNQTDNAYRLAIHQGAAPDGNCNNPSIGSLLDPANIFTKPNYECDPASIATTCALGDLFGKFSGFKGTADGKVNITWNDPMLPFNNADNATVIGRTVMLYDARNDRLACGTIVADKVDSSVPQTTDASEGFAGVAVSKLTLALATILGLGLAVVF